MDYELAKKLKDAGYPQKGYWFYSTNETDEPVLTTEAYVYGTENLVKTADGKNWEKVKLCFAPTLSELIEACGNRFFGFFRCTAHSNGGYCWKAEAVDSMGNIDDLVQSGETPEEAVANLWLALNKKA